MIDMEFPVIRTRGLVVQDANDEVLVYDTETDRAHCLNKTAAMVWQACDGATSVERIAQDLSERSGTRVPEDLVWVALDQLAEHRLLEREVPVKFAGGDRREVMRKIGVGAMVALPVIASLAAPKSVWAQGSCVCQNNASCASQTSCPSTTNCKNLAGGAKVCAP